MFNNSWKLGSAFLACLGSACSGDPSGNEAAPTVAPSMTSSPDTTSTDPTAPTTVATMPTNMPAPTVSAPPPPLPALKCTPPAVVCEDFESGAVHTSVWGIRAPNALLEVVQDRAAHGKFSMHLHTGADSNSQSQLVETSFLGENFFGRVYAYFPVKPRNAHAAIFEGLGNNQGFATSISVSVSSAANIFIGFFHDNPFFDNGTTPKPGVPVGKWFCLEWNFRPVEGVDNHIWVDGKEVAAFVQGDKFNTGATDFKIPPFTEARVGWSHSAHKDPDPFTDVWMDDVAFGPERIGCN